MKTHFYTIFLILATVAIKLKSIRVSNQQLNHNYSKVTQFNQ